MKGFLSLSLLPLLAAASPVIVDTIHNDAAPVLSSVNAREVPNSYIVVFKKHVDQGVATAHYDWVGDVHLSSIQSRTELRKRSQFPFQDEVFQGLRHTYNIAGQMLGYSGHFDDDVLEQIRRHPDVSLIARYTCLTYISGDRPHDTARRTSDIAYLAFHPHLMC